jgi:hypothetical protein
LRLYLALSPTEVGTTDDDDDDDDDTHTPSRLPRLPPAPRAHPTAAAA